MKTTRIGLLALLLLGIAGGAGYASVRTSVGVSVHSSNVDLGFFYDDLAPYGNWVQRPSYGWVWTPREVAVNWRPYQDGHWVWTDQGWLWVTDEPFGWATYHYGRWYDDPDIGWSWVPGDDWAPSWTSWQEGGDYVGWAPLPPSISVVSGFNGARLSVAIGAGAYTFVPERYFLAPSIAAYVVSGPQVFPIFHRTRNITSYRFTGGRVFCDGVSVSRVGRFHGGRVPRYQLADFGAGFRHRGAQFRGNQVAVFRPQVRRARVAAPSLRPAARRSVVTASELRTTRIRRGGRAVATAPSRQERQGLQARQTRQAERSREVTRLRSSQTRRATPPPRAVARQHKPPVRSVRQTQTSRTRILSHERGRPSVRTQQTRRTVRTTPNRSTVRTRERTVTHTVRPPARSREVRQSVRTQRARPQVRTREVRQTVRTQRVKPAQRMTVRPTPRQQSRPQRMQAPPRQRQQARPPAQRQQNRPGRHRPPQ